MQKALEQDSTVYDYDAVYDEIQNERQEKTQKILHGTDKRVIFSFQSCSMFFLLKLHVVASISVISHVEWHIAVWLNSVECYFGGEDYMLIDYIKCGANLSGISESSNCFKSCVNH